MGIAARRLGVSRQTLWKYLQRWPELAEIVSDRLEERLDIAESKLDRAIMKGEAWAICFFLKTRGKDRGGG